MTTIISSQRYINQDIVDAHSAAGQYAVLLSPAFELDGESYQVVLDGHHSLAAALQDGVTPEYRVATLLEHDTIGLLEQGDAEAFLQATYMDSDWYDVATDNNIWQ